VLLTHRNAIEQDLSNLFDHMTVDGTRLDPDRDSFEDEYQALLASLETANRAMYVTYAMFLDTSPPSMGPYALSMEDIECPPSTGPDIPPCPYQHVSKQSTVQPTTPTLEVIDVTVNDTVAQALFTHTAQRRPGTSIDAIADSGASHILFRKSDSHVLTSVEYTRPDMPPFAVLKAANGQHLARDFSPSRLPYCSHGVRIRGSGPCLQLAWDPVRQCWMYIQIQTLYVSCVPPRGPIRYRVGNSC
jgi:hypothetical protein